MTKLKLAGVALFFLCALPFPAFARTWDIKIEGMQFVPTELAVKAGDTVTWTNSDILPHTVTGEGGGKSVDSGELSPGKKFRRTMKKAGDFSYLCRLHPTMKGKVSVER
jgi:plastocyanin